MELTARPEMRQIQRRILLLCLVFVGPAACTQGVESCPVTDGVTLQILGSGGPIADDGRASAGYIVWIDGESRVMIDAGGGTFLRFGESGAKFASLDFIGLSHFHTDHSADLPALLKSGYFSDRQRSLVVAGPGPSTPFPGLNTYLDSMLGKPDGAYAYLSGYLDGTGGLARIEPFEIEKDNSAAVTVLGDDNGAVQIKAQHVPHGIVPALAFRLRIGGASIVFASDQNGDDPAFVEFAKGASLLVMHMVVPEGVSGAGRKLHAPPSVIGSIAQDAGVDTLVLSHLMARSLKNLDKNVEIVKANYDGHVIVANDLDCITLKN
jgi:ribonuclease BN (tRNA processing enzyme)